MISIPTTDDFARLEAAVEQQTAIVRQLLDEISAHRSFPLMMKRDQAITYSGLPGHTLDRLVKAGQISWRQVGTSKRLSRTDIDRLIAEAANTASPPTNVFPLHDDGGGGTAA